MRYLVLFIFCLIIVFRIAASTIDEQPSTPPSINTSSSNDYSSFNFTIPKPVLQSLIDYSSSNFTVPKPVPQPLIDYSSVNFTVPKPVPRPPVEVLSFNYSAFERVLPPPIDISSFNFTAPKTVLPSPVDIPSYRYTSPPSDPSLSSYESFYSSSGDVRVNGYYRKDGTYVRGHYRSRPDGNPYNNYSFPGNYNPYTGKYASGSADTYLENYYGR